MRLEIEMSNVTEEARQAIDEDLAQIDHSIGQLMEYARPAGLVPEQGIDVSSVLHDLYERERSHTESLGDSLVGSIEPNLYAKINAHDLKRIVSNLIENARRYGRSPADDKAHIELSARQDGNILAIEIRDQGQGIAPTDIQRLLRPFSRGETARTGVSGAGLGLAIVERLLGQVGGQLQLLPRPTGGLVARIEIPKSRTRGLSDTQAA
jgi:two-component system osmolarity sensor histidine kinase EnvZ